MCNQDRAHDIDIFPGENQTQTKINIVEGLKTYSDYLKKYFTTYQGFTIHLVILKIPGKY